MFTRTSEYALRAAIHLAQHQDRWPIPGKQIAEEAGIPPKYLAKVLGDLVRAGVLHSNRGKSGGFSMVRSPEDVRLIEIVAPFEQLDRRRCPFGRGTCNDENPCPAHHTWQRVVQVEQDFLSRTTVRDIAARRD
ncbi:MAG: RrF2 family transcriptional regulator [Phycisphaerae bacterium]